jgi:hypothetical protein
MLFEVLRPLLLLVFREKAQLSKWMSITEGMDTLGILRVAAVTVMLHNPAKLREDAYLIGGRLAALAMHC